MKDINETIDIDLINIQALKKSMIIITTDKENVSMVSKNFIIITSKVTPTERNRSFKGSGKVVLAIIKHTNSKDPDHSKWNDGLVEKIKETKPNICEPDGPNNHFHSQGIVAAWGNKALYGRSTENSTVGQYVNKPIGKNTTNDQIVVDSKELEDLVTNEVKKGIGATGSYLWIR